MKSKPERHVLTIGHSTLALDAFLDLLKGNAVTLLADVRTIPRSRHNPQFNQDMLPAGLRDVGIVYSHRAGLGGLRKTRPDSPNGGWRNASFRGFADYMQTTEFDAEIKALIEILGTEQIALMCAEAVPWRCHRSLIADALVVRRISVEHIFPNGMRRPQSRTPFAKVAGTRITYPAA